MRYQDIRIICSAWFVDEKYTMDISHSALIDTDTDIMPQIKEYMHWAESHDLSLKNRDILGHVFISAYWIDNKSGKVKQITRG